MLIRRLGFLAVALLGLCACDNVVVRNLSEEQANDVLLALSKVEIDARKQAESPGVFSVRVAIGQTTAALGALRDMNLPKDAPNDLTTFSQGGGIVPSRLRDQAAYDSARAAELAQSLERLPGIDRARVHLVTRKREGWRVSQPPDGHAAVLLQGVAHDPSIDEEVKKLLSGGVANLPRGNIEIVRVAMPSPANTASSSPSRTPEKWMLVLSLLCNMLLALLLLRGIIKPRQRTPL